jgi:hypothetical protein
VLHRFTDFRLYTIAASDGEIGTVEDAYLDDRTWTVRYLVIATGTWLSGRKVLLSPLAIRGVDVPRKRLETVLTKRQIEESPPIDTAKPVSRQYETALATHYGYDPYWAGPNRWGIYAYPYPLLQTGTVPSMSEPSYGNKVAELDAREQKSHDPNLRSARAVTGYGLRATDGDLGHVEDFLIDEQDWAVRYLVTDPRSWWPGPHVLVGVDSIRSVSWEESVVVVDISREALRNGPRY